MADDPPEFRDEDHAKLWKQINENSKSIISIEADLSWVKRILIAILAGIIITFLSTMI